MALVASMTVFLDVLVALTLLPALLGLAGERIVTKKARQRYAKKDHNQPSFADHWIKGLLKGKWLVVALVILILGTLAVPVAQMDLGMPSGASSNLDTVERQSYDLITEGFGEGYNGTLAMVAEDQAVQLLKLKTTFN